MTVDKRIRDARVPANDRDAVVVTCSCGATMTANVRRRFGEPSYLWWACTDNPNHVTRAIPLPGVLAMPSGRRVVVERVDVYDGAYVVRWKAGSHLGSLMPLRAGDEWEVVRR